MRPLLFWHHLWHIEIGNNILSSIIRGDHSILTRKGPSSKDIEVFQSINLLIWISISVVMDQRDILTRIRGNEICKLIKNICVDFSWASEEILFFNLRSATAISFEFLPFIILKSRMIYPYQNKNLFLLKQEMFESSTDSARSDLIFQRHQISMRLYLYFLN